MPASVKPPRSSDRLAAVARVCILLIGTSFIVLVSMVVVRALHARSVGAPVPSTVSAVSASAEAPVPPVPEVPVAPSAAIVVPEASAAPAPSVETPPSAAPTPSAVPTPRAPGRSMKSKPKGEDDPFDEPPSRRPDDPYG
jgi:hypothetical protein